MTETASIAEEEVRPEEPRGATAPRPGTELLARLGLFVARGFLDAELCAQIRARARQYAWEQARVNASGVAVNQEIRRTLTARLTPEDRELVTARLEGCRPAVERHFGLPATTPDEPRLLRYRVGDFFVAHRDVPPEPGVDERAARRRLSLILFLNDEREQPGDDVYGGGALLFYGLLKDARAQGHAFPLHGEAGLLVAFPSDLYHEVQPVTHGERYTIVSWLS